MELLKLMIVRHIMYTLFITHMYICIIYLFQFLDSNIFEFYVIIILYIISRVILIRPTHVPLSCHGSCRAISPFCIRIPPTTNVFGSRVLSCQVVGELEPGLSTFPDLLPFLFLITWYTKEMLNRTKTEPKTLHKKVILTPTKTKLDLQPTSISNKVVINNFLLQSSHCLEKAHKSHENRAMVKILEIG